MVSRNPHVTPGEKVTYETEKYQWGIVGVVKVGWPGSVDIATKEGQKDLIHQGERSRHGWGVRFRKLNTRTESSCPPI